jgi:hypothetical protein
MGQIEWDPVGRGALGSRQVVVNKTPLPVRREGGDPAPVAPGLVNIDGRPLPQGVVYGYDENFNVVPLSQ